MKQTKVMGVALAIGTLLAGCQSDTGTRSQTAQYFTVKVGNEQFVMLVSDPATVELAIQNFQGKNYKFPMGKIASGDGGYNQPWDWHFVPDTIRMVDVAVEVCDGVPSYVNSHESDYLVTGYCPWSARVVKIGR